MIKRICHHCGISFDIYPSGLKYGKGKFCSETCRRKNRNYGRRIPKTCLICGKFFSILPAREKKGEGKYCNRKCMGISKRGENNPHWAGGIKVVNERIRNKPYHLLNNRMRGGIRESLRNNSKNGRHWEDLVNYTIKDLIKRLKKTIPERYTWQDFLDGKLHIDHIIPISAFDFDNPEDFDFTRCWALNNLQLLTPHENYKKSKKLIKPFQTGLKI